MVSEKREIGGAIRRRGSDASNFAKKWLNPLPTMLKGYTVTGRYMGGLFGTSGLAFGLADWGVQTVTGAKSNSKYIAKTVKALTMLVGRLTGLIGAVIALVAFVALRAVQAVALIVHVLARAVYLDPSRKFKRSVRGYIDTARQAEKSDSDTYLAKLVKSDFTNGKYYPKMALRSIVGLGHVIAFIPAVIAMRVAGKDSDKAERWSSKIVSTISLAFSPLAVIIAYPVWVIDNALTGLAVRVTGDRASGYKGWVALINGAAESVDNLAAEAYSNTGAVVGMESSIAPKSAVKVFNKLAASREFSEKVEGLDQKSAKQVETYKFPSKADCIPGIEKAHKGYDTLRESARSRMSGGAVAAHDDDEGGLHHRHSVGSNASE